MCYCCLLERYEASEEVYVAPETVLGVEMYYRSLHVVDVKEGRARMGASKTKRVLLLVFRRRAISI